MELDCWNVFSIKDDEYFEIVLYKSIPKYVEHEHLVDAALFHRTPMENLEF